MEVPQLLACPSLSRGQPHARQGVRRCGATCGQGSPGSCAQGLAHARVLTSVSGCSSFSWPVLSLLAGDWVSDWVSGQVGSLLARGLARSATPRAVALVGFLLAEHVGLGALVLPVVADDVGAVLLAPPADREQLGHGVRGLGEAA